MAFIIERPGTYDLIVDSGRFGWRHVGVPVGGPADRTAWMLANALVGNGPEKSVALELTWSGPVLRATADHACALVGAEFSPHVAGRKVPRASVWHVRADEVIEVGTATNGLRAYLAVAGGFEYAPLLGSRSALQPLRKGEVLLCKPQIAPRRRWLEPLPHAAIFTASTTVLRILPGPFWLQVAELVAQRTWTVSAESNRMGLRLRADVAWELPHDLPSVPVCIGTIQATASGQLLILGVDGPTIGGYPRIGYVIEADWDLLGQLRPQQSVRFLPVTLEGAYEAVRALRAWRHQVTLRLLCGMRCS
ncbi:MAG: biotin-dependent carboxyltransferase family protein [Gemmatales bacterium]|nr:biotin-dependent carboxyltransferase family protein [Gemmatales bacterium]